MRFYLSDLRDEFYYQYDSTFSIKYVYQGVDNYKLCKIPHHVRTGQALIINEGSEVTAWSPKLDGTGSHKGMSVFLDRNLINDFLSILNWPKEIPYYNNEQKSIDFYNDIIHDDKIFLTYLQKLFLTYQSNKDIELDITLYYEICEYLFQYQFSFLSKIEKISKVRYSTKKEIYSRVSLAKQIIETNYLLPFDLDFLARESAMSKYFLIKCFKSVYYFTPQKYYQHIRLKKAEELLKNRKTITEVADILGYKNLSGFCKMFAHLTKTTALKFKNSH